MPGFGGVTVDAPEGPRWELALALIDSGEAPIQLGEVEIWRNVARSTADGVIRMAMRVGEHADREVGRPALLTGRRVVAEATSADSRFAGLLDQYGCRWEIVSDYGMGTLLLGEADDGGDLIWRA
jgi:hypothetical protein